MIAISQFTWFPTHHKFGIANCCIRDSLTFSNLPPTTVFLCPFKCSTARILGATGLAVVNVIINCTVVIIPPINVAGIFIPFTS